MIRYKNTRMINDTDKNMGIVERESRCKLASLYRMIDINKSTNIFYNYISCKINENEILIIPSCLYPNEITACSLFKCDINGNMIDVPISINTKALKFHQFIYTKLPSINCIIHIQNVWTTVISSMKNPIEFLAGLVDIVGEISYYDSGITNHDCFDKIVKSIAKDKIIVIKNNGIIFMGYSIEEAFCFMYRTLNYYNLKISASAFNNNCTFDYIKLNTAFFDENLTRFENILFDSYIRYLERHGHYTGLCTLDHNYTSYQKGSFLGLGRLTTDSGIGTMNIPFSDHIYSDENEYYEDEFHNEQIPSSESSKELHLKKCLLYEDYESLSNKNICSNDINNSEHPRRKKSKSFVRRSKSLTSGVEKAIFRKYNEMLFTENCN